MSRSPGATPSALVCAGCGASPGQDDPYPFRCPNATNGDDTDHVLRRILDLSAVRFPTTDGREGDGSPYIRYRHLFHSYHLARAGGMEEADYCALVERLDGEVARVDGHGFLATPFARADDLSEQMGFAADGGVWVKDETGNVSGCSGSWSISRWSSDWVAPIPSTGRISRSRVAGTPPWPRPSSLRPAGGCWRCSSPSTPTPSSSPG